MSSTWVRENSACKMEMSYRYPAARSARVNGCGRRASHLRSSAPVCAGPRAWQIACRAGTSSTAAKALSSGVKPIPALAACRLAHSLPLMHSLALNGK